MNYYGLNQLIADTGLKTATLIRIVKEFKAGNVHPDRYKTSKTKRNY